METQEGIVKFTAAELGFVKEKLEAEVLFHTTMTPRDVEERLIFEVKASGGSMEEWKGVRNDLISSLKEFAEEPDVLFTSNDLVAVEMVINMCKIKKEVGFKKQICLGVLRKLDKALAAVKKYNEENNIVVE